MICAASAARVEVLRRPGGELEPVRASEGVAEIAYPIFYGGYIKTSTLYPNYISKNGYTTLKRRITQWKELILEKLL